MHAYFDGYVHSNTVLNESMVQYKQTAHARLEVKDKRDF